MTNSLYDIPVNRLDGTPSSLGDFKGKVVLVVNVASRCGLTPQYEGLQRLQERFGPERFTVVGFPCNQFLGQEPGTPEEIAQFCSTTYGVDFPLFEKIEVNGDGQHPIYALLTRVQDASGYSGDIRWNFEKFLLSSDGEVVARFEPQCEPEDERVVSAIEAELAKVS
ncbi:MAG: glutathione peroxidase [Acidimicrobiales bacterium]|nr:glutathione peroxidase [Acidimicrobiales bacterium]